MAGKGEKRLQVQVAVAYVNDEDTAFVQDPQVILKSFKGQEVHRDTPRRESVQEERVE